MSLLIGNKEDIKMNLQGKKVLVFGSGKSGIGAAELLATGWCSSRSFMMEMQTLTKKL